jgi:hypothetical protein
MPDSKKEQYEAAVKFVDDFITANYDADHDCGDEDCPGNTYESEFIVQNVLNLLGVDTKDVQWFSETAVFDV